MGKLNWASQVICGGRAFLRRVLDLKNSVKERRHKVLLTNDFSSVVVIIHKSIQWHVPNTGTPSYLVSPKFQTNASSEGGGGYYNGDYFYVNWALDLPDCASEQINVKEFVAIFLAVFRSSNNFLYKKVVIYSDNASGVS